MNQPQHHFQYFGIEDFSIIILNIFIFLYNHTKNSNNINFIENTFKTNLKFTTIFLNGFKEKRIIIINNVLF